MRFAHVVPSQIKSTHSEIESSVSKSRGQILKQLRKLPAVAPIGTKKFCDHMIPTEWFGMIFVPILKSHVTNFFQNEKIYNF